MVKSEYQEKVIIYIDNSNLFHGICTHDPAIRIDFKKLREILTGSRKCIDVKLYASEVSSMPEKQTAFYKKLEYDGISVILTEQRIRGGKIKEEAIDVALAIDMMADVCDSKVDAVVLVAGDGDYVPLVKKVRRRGVKVQLAFCNVGLSDKLRRAVHSFIDLDKVMNEVRLIPVGYVNASTTGKFLPVKICPCHCVTGMAQ